MERVPHPLMASRSHLGPQGEAGSGVRGFGQCVDYLLNMLDIRLLAAIQVLEVDAGKAVRVFQATKAGAVGQRVRIGPSHPEVWA